MKKIFGIGFIAILAVMVLTSSSPKKKKKSKMFRGIVTYDISYDGDALTDLQKSKLPTTVSVKMYDGMSKFDEVMGPALQTTIINPKADKYTVLIEVGDKKAAYLGKYSDMNNDSTIQYTTVIDYSADTKIIAGYSCKKAIVTFTPKEGVDDEERMFTVYYSEELAGAEENEDGFYKGIPGLLLESYQVSPGMVVKYTATEVKKGKVKDLDFLLPSDFKEFTDQEALMNYLMGK
jgi:GLPGLI family protein